MGVHRETTVDDIINDLKDSEIVVTAKDIECKSKDNAPLKSYHISVPAADLQKALNPSIWPMRVKVREYIYYPKKQQKNGSQTQNDERKSTAPAQNDEQILQEQTTPGGLQVSNQFSVLTDDDSGNIMQS